MTRLSSGIRQLATVVAFAFVWLGGCSASSKEGVTVSVLIEAPSSPALAGGARTFDTGRGVHVTLSRGFLTTGSVEIVGCATATASWNWLDALRLREARAHVVGSPTVLGVPRVESLLAEAGARTAVGDLHPPPGSYCKVKQTILAADPDAPGLPPDGSMLGKSLLVEGTYAVGGGAPQAFLFTSTASFDVETMIAETALSVDGRRTAKLVVVTTGDRWFDGVDFGGDEQDASTRVLENLRASLGALVE